ncbi:MAG TPA: hypothetical protein VHU42_02710 [Rhodopila sp.]|nr:hypothetical protein [Rhodopila sp.]
MRQPTSQPNQETSVFNCTLETIVGFLLPFFLAAAGGNTETAEATVRHLISAYSATTATELDLVGRIIGFGIASLDNLRLSMDPGLSTNKLLRYRSNAVSLSRASNQAQKALDALRTRPDQPLPIPRPSVAAALPAAALPAAALPAAALPAAVRTALPAPQAAESIAFPPLDIETMKRDARIMMMAFSKNGAQPHTAASAIANPAIGAAAFKETRY